MTVHWEESSQANSEKNGKGKLPIIVIAIFVIIGVMAFLALDGADWFKRLGGDIVPETTVSQIAFSDDPTAISAASQSVVKLNCYDKNGDLYATGSGFACFADNVIVTNYHVIEGSVYNIEASTEDGNTFDIAYVLATDEAKDIAILGTSVPHNLALLQPGNSDDLQKGEKVVAIGSPLGLLNSVSTGVFSGYTDENGMDVLQFTASISSGSSGGALFNDAGEVLGITFASYEAGQNLNLAIPMKYVEHLYAKSEIADRMTIEQFYATHIPTYTVDQVISLGNALEGSVFYIDGYIHSHGVAYRENGRDWDSIWCIVCSSAGSGVCTGESVLISYTAVYPEEMPYNLIKSKARLELLNIGENIRLRCEYELGEPNLTLVEVEYIE